MLSTMSATVRLPHAYPFKFISREDGEGNTELAFSASADDAVCRGAHLPTWVILEAMTQAAGLLMATGGGGGALVQVSSFRCPRPMGAGDVLCLRGVCLKRMGPVLRVRMSARREGKLVARGVLTLRVEG